MTCAEDSCRPSRQGEGSDCLSIPPAFLFPTSLGRLGSWDLISSDLNETWVQVVRKHLSLHFCYGFGMFWVPICICVELTGREYPVRSDTFRHFNLGFAGLVLCHVPSLLGIMKVSLSIGVVAFTLWHNHWTFANVLYIDMKKFVAPLPPSILSHRHALMFTKRAKTINNFEFLCIRYLSPCWVVFHPVFLFPKLRHDKLSVFCELQWSSEVQSCCFSFPKVLVDYKQCGTLDGTGRVSGFISC